MRTQLGLAFIVAWTLVLWQAPAGAQNGPLPVPEMVSVPAGQFPMGDPSGDGEDDERPVHTITLSAYAIGKYEVTNGDYAAALNWALVQGYLDMTSEGQVRVYGNEALNYGSAECQIAFTGVQFIVEDRDGLPMDDHPVVDVSWYGAVAYCNWLSEASGLQPCYDPNDEWWTLDPSKNGYHLPTEAQWERAAAWDGSQRYLFGVTDDTIDCSSANFWTDALGACNPLGLTAFPYTTPVGYFDGSKATVNSPSPVGCYDMAGNVWEWCNDRYGSTYYESDPGPDPVGPDWGSSRVFRGGGWDDFSYNCTSASRGYGSPQGMNYVVGLRLARSQEARAEDINGDTAVDAIDVQLVINAALGIDIGGLNGDVNGDQSVDAIDVQLVINAALGL